MTLLFSPTGTKSVTASETDIFTIITTQNYYGLYVFVNNMGASHTVDIRIYIWDNTDSVYRLLDTHTFTGVQTDTAKFIPLLPLRRAKITVQRTGGSDFNMNYEVVSQTG